MKITKDEIIHVANLARLELNEDVIDKFCNQVGQILDYVDTLNQIDTKNVSLTSHASSSTNAFREDIEIESIGMEQGLANAPGKEDGCFIVPKVIG
ncbi:MAG: Asp-tRNA(Asn)/Glu-tRNA(Gln) amidotransferase subunit GatC [Proteobacteria bacterium]|nr:Asp-tRNA(Asn)/Glu-tRNA(Gln) amidotransferase subunit GatC [Pseudomonadota bacterium]